MQPLFYKLFSNIARCYTGKNLLYQLGAFVLTYLFIVSGFDWWYFEKTNALGMTVFFFAPALIGLVVPIFLPLGLLIGGYMRNNFNLKNMAFALGQSALIALGMSSLYKVFTGRVPHDFRALTTAASSLVNISNNFQFGFYRGGAFQGWPSSHTAVAFAMAFSLVALYPKHTPRDRVIRWSAIIYALYIGIGVSTNIHWFSDFVAGAILGAIIGLSVGKAFHHRLGATA